MHPAISVIFFTTASGAGYGLLAILGAATALGMVPTATPFLLVAWAVALAMITLGLMSSTFHLGHPERAWRALSQWRSSWLSREGVMAILTFGPALLLGLGFWLESGALIRVMGLIAAIAALITVFTTSMIYGSLKTIRQWANPLVPLVYLTFAIATGAVLFVGLHAMFAPTGSAAFFCAAGALVLAWLVKLVYWRAIDGGVSPSDAGTATGLGAIGTVRQLEPPHTQANWVMREMGFSVARKHAAKLRKLALITGCLLPLLAFVLAVALPGMAAAFGGLAMVFVAIGVVTERWLFFAEATHVVTLFYGRQAA